MNNALAGVFNVVRELVRREAARLVAWSSVAAGAAAVAVGSALGIELSPEFLAGLGVFAGLVATEVIRVLVFSEKTHDELVDKAVEDAETP